MSRPTPCADWDLRALLLHMNESLLTLHEAIASGRLGLDAAGSAGDPAADYGDPTADPVAALRNRGCQMIGAWANAPELTSIVVEDKPLSSGLVAATGAVEVAVHGWDVAGAIGARRPIPPALAEELLELSPMLVRDADRPTRFAPPVHVAANAGVSDRLLAFLGRDPAGCG
jgi:uncharacterized protein (TIGR03086 family)